MIKYDRLWKTMKEKGVSQYSLYTHHNVNRAQIDRLKHNRNVEVNTIDKLCNILHCRVEDIMEHFDDDNLFLTIFLLYMNSNFLFISLYILSHNVSL